MKVKPILLMRVSSPFNKNVDYLQFYKRYMFRPTFVQRHMWGYGTFYLKNPIIFWSLLGIRKLI